MKEKLFRVINHKGPVLAQEYPKLHVGLGNTLRICLLAIVHSLRSGGVLQTGPWANQTLALTWDR